MRSCLIGELGNMQYYVGGHMWG